MEEDSQETPDGKFNAIVNLYKQAVKNVPLLRYSWILVATICILTMAAYFKLKNSDVFWYAIGVILISFLGFLFSYLLKIPDRFIRFLLYMLITCVVVTLGTAVLGLGSYIIWEKPSFYARWFPNEKPPPPIASDSNVKIRQDTPVMKPPVIQIHYGPGDNVNGDKYVNTPKSDRSQPAVSDTGKANRHDSIVKKQLLH